MKKKVTIFFLIANYDYLKHYSKAQLIIHNNNVKEK